MAAPEISVLMGVYYQRDDISLLKRSIMSILNQTFSDFELLICDDGSQAQAKEYLEDMARQDQRVYLVREGRLFSLPEKLNACLRLSRGKWLARMDDDDFSFPERFAKQVEVLASNQEIAFTGSNVELQRKGVPVGNRVFPERPAVRDFFFSQPYAHPTLIFRRDAILAVNGYSESPHCILCEDYDLLLRLYTKGYRGMNLQENLLIYTLSVTAKGNRKMKHRWNETVVRYCRFKELGVLPKALPYVIKPLIVGVTPEPILKRVKEILS